jgi:hypothetical protein
MARKTGMGTIGAALTIGAVLALGGCTPSVDKTGPANAQGWSPGNQRFWWETSQGSRLVPKAWYDALEQVDSTALFSDQTYLAQFGYLPSAADRLAERGENLPIGFAVDKQSDTGLARTGLHWYEGQKSDKEHAEPWVGMNCSACHTTKITYKTDEFLIDGAPTTADFQGFINAFDGALRQTLTMDDKFGRFATKVLVGKDTPANRALLKTKLGEMLAWQDRVAKLNGDRPGGPVKPYGFGRLDAVGHILNKVALYNMAVPQNGNLANAPVSYPFLWDITKQKRVQWNGSASNAKLKLNKGELDYGAMGRNTGEVIGVFGEVMTVKPGSKLQTLKGFQSTVSIDGLVRLEEVLMKLESPKWPVQFGAIDEPKRVRGEQVFDQLKCGSCHIEKEDWKEGEPIERMLTLKEMNAATPSNLTDIWMACNAATIVANTGNLQGAKDGIFTGNEFGPVEPVFGQLAYTVKLSLLGKKRDIIDKIAQIYLGIEKQPVIEGVEDPTDTAQRCISGDGFGAETQKILAYKARPLDGIWATAPYLHNGSVPTLYHLLLAPQDRPKTFFSGSREFDPQFVGYVWKNAPAGPHSLIDTSVFASSNQGHDYGVGGLSEPDRLALLEYLKSL